MTKNGFFFKNRKTTQFSHLYQYCRADKAAQNGCLRVEKLIRFLAPNFNFKKFSGQNLEKSWVLSLKWYFLGDHMRILKNEFQIRNPEGLARLYLVAELAAKRFGTTTAQMKLKNFRKIFEKFFQLSNNFFSTF